jgi:hypothetical protein
MEQPDTLSSGTAGSPPTRHNGRGPTTGEAPPPEPAGATPDGPPAGPAVPRATVPRVTVPRATVPRAKAPSSRPALVVVGIAAGLLLLFGIASAVTGTSSPPKPSRPASAGRPLKGTSLRAEPAAGLLQAIERPGTPPADVLQSLFLPVGATKVSSKPWDGETQFNGEVAFRSAASQAAVVGFFRAELSASGWSISSVGPARGQAGATEVLAQRSSTDGWYWGVGVVVSPTTFSNGATTDSTRFTLDLFQEPQTD